jgi:alpha-glucosidase
MVRASRQGLLLANPNKRPFILSRSNFLGGHRYAATWTGDNLSSVEQMKLSVPMSLTLGLSGQPFSGPDIGGFCENSNADLLAQWTAMGVFFPFVRNHSIDGSVDQEPWAFDGKVLDVCRTAIERRYLLMPYIYTAFREASVDGMPVMRPLFMADPKDRSLRGEEQAFLLGADLMVIPRWAEHVAQPHGGSWQVINGLSSMSSYHDDDPDDPYQAILRQRPGSIIPMAQLAQSTAEMRTDSLTLLVCLDADGKASGQLYEDDGDGFAYRRGNYLLSRFEASLLKRQLTVTMTAAEGKRQDKARTLRIGCVKGGRVQYSPWQQGSTATMKVK